MSLDWEMRHLLGLWRLLGHHLLYKKVMATRNAISFNDSELTIFKNVLWQKGLLWRGKMESKVHQTKAACTLGNSSPRGLLSLKTMHGQVSSCVCHRKDVLQQKGRGGAWWQLHTLILRDSISIHWPAWGMYFRSHILTRLYSKFYHSWDSESHRIYTSKKAAFTRLILLLWCAAVEGGLRRVCTLSELPQGCFMAGCPDCLALHTAL